MHLQKRHKVEEMIKEVNSPTRLVIIPDRYGSKIKNKYFD